MTKHDGDKLGYVPALDGLRAISIAMVVGHHSPLENSFFFDQGGAGVDVFFVLSGYLITALLLGEKEETGRIGLRDFYVRRFLRIVPVFWVWVLVLTFSGTEAPGFLLWVLTYTSNVALALGAMRLQGAAPLSWSLSMEEQFYACWPPLVKRLDRRKLIFGVLAAIVAFTAWRQVLVGRGVFRFPELYARPDARMDTIAWGCLAALVEGEGWFTAMKGKIIASRRLVLSVLLVLGACSYRLAELHEIYPGRLGFTVQAALTACAILWLRCCPASRVTRLLGSWPFVWIGRLSYSIYLWHLAVIYFCFWPVVNRIPGEVLAKMPAWAVWSGGAAYWIVLVVASGVVSYFLVEKPFLRLKKRFAPGLRSPAPPLPVG